MEEAEELMAKFVVSFSHLLSPTLLTPRLYCALRHGSEPNV